VQFLHQELALKEIFYGGRRASGEGAQKMITVVAVQCGRGQWNAQKCSGDADRTETAGVVRREDTNFLSVLSLIQIYQGSGWNSLQWRHYSYGRLHLLAEDNDWW